MEKQDCTPCALMAAATILLAQQCGCEAGRECADPKCEDLRSRFVAGEISLRSLAAPLGVSMETMDFLSSQVDIDSRLDIQTEGGE